MLSLGECVFHAYMSVAYVFCMFVDYVIILYAWWFSLWQLFHHVEVDGVVVGCGRHECMSVMHWLCKLVLICFYAYIDMVIVVMHEIMVCGWYGHVW